MQTKVSSRLYRGPHPTTPQHFQWLGERGITTIIDLQGNLKERLGNELEAVMEEFPGRVLWLPMSSLLPPSRSRLQQILNMLLALPGRTYVCCEQGVDRTGMMCAFYRVKVEDWDIEMAIAEMMDSGFHAFPYLFLGWEYALRLAVR